MYAKLERSSMTEIFQGGLHEFITEFIEDNARLRPRSPNNISSPEKGRAVPICGSGFRTRSSTASSPPARTVNQILRLTPLSFDSQYVLRWRIDVDANGALRETEDGHGNAVTSYSHHGLIERLAVSAAGEVETSDAAGVVRGAVERLPAEMYLRESPLAHVNGALRDFAAEAAKAPPIRSIRCIG